MIPGIPDVIWYLVLSTLSQPITFLQLFPCGPRNLTDFPSLEYPGSGYGHLENHIWSCATLDSRYCAAAGVSRCSENRQVDRFSIENKYRYITKLGPRKGYYDYCHVPCLLSGLWIFINILKLLHDK